jgi:hypothetical protein
MIAGATGGTAWASSAPISATSPCPTRRKSSASRQRANADRDPGIAAGEPKIV